MDTYQDHATVIKEGFRAFKTASILGYELPHELLAFKNTTLVKMPEEYLKKKVVVLSPYVENLKPVAEKVPVSK